MMIIVIIVIIIVGVGLGGLALGRREELLPVLGRGRIILCCVILTMCVYVIW